MKCDVPHKPRCFYWINYFSGYQISIMIVCFRLLCLVVTFYKL
jgi:hypothetical protein